MQFRTVPFGKLMMLDKLTESILIEQSGDTLARWSCMLNAWDWPSDIPNPESQEEWERLRKEGRQSRRTAIREWIDKRVGEWLISREWNVGSGRMTAEQHEDYFKGIKEGDQEAKMRHEKWTEEYIAKRMTGK